MVKQKLAPTTCGRPGGSIGRREWAVFGRELNGRPPTSDEQAGRFAFLAPSLLLRMALGSRGVPVGEIAVFESRGCVRLRLFVMADLVKIGRLVVMVRGGVVVSGRLICDAQPPVASVAALRNTSRERAGVRV